MQLCRRCGTINKNCLIKSSYPGLNAKILGEGDSKDAPKLAI